MVSWTESRPGRVTTLMRPSAERGMTKRARHSKRSPPVLGRSSVQPPERLGTSKNVFTVSRCCARGRAQSGRTGNSLRGVSPIAGGDLVSELLLFTRFEGDDKFYFGGIHIFILGLSGDCPIAGEVATEIEHDIDLLRVLDLKLPAFLDRPALDV